MSTLKARAKGSKSDARVNEALHERAKGAKADVVRLNLWLDAEIHRQLRRKSKIDDTTMKALVESALMKVYGFTR